MHSHQHARFQWFPCLPGSVEPPDFCSMSVARLAWALPDPGPYSCCSTDGPGPGSQGALHELLTFRVLLCFSWGNYNCIKLLKISWRWTSISITSHYYWPVKIPMSPVSQTVVVPCHAGVPPIAHRALVHWERRWWMFRHAELATLRGTHLGVHGIP